MHPKEVKVDLGVLQRDDIGNVVGFIEKPTYHYMVSMGVYAMNRRVLSYFEPGASFGFDQLMLAMLAANDPIATFDWSQGRWLDIGRPSDFAVAQETFAAERLAYLPWERQGAPE